MSDQIENDDLDLIDDNIEDDGKDDAALWAEIDAEEHDGTTESDEETQASSDSESVSWGADDDSADDDTGAADDSKGQSDAKAASDAKQQAQDIWANATPEHRAAYQAAQKDWENQDRRYRGQVSALQRQINELAKSQQQPQAAASTQAAAEGTQAKVDGFLASDEWTRFQEDYPEISEPLSKVLGSLQMNTAEVTQKMSALAEERRQAEVAAQISEQQTILATEHPDWNTIGATPEFVSWVNTQPRHIREAAERNGEAIVDATEAADLISRYKSFANITDSAQGHGQGQPNNNRLAGKRKRQLESASAARAKGPGAAFGIPEDGDPKVLWDHFDEMEKREARG